MVSFGSKKTPKMKYVGVERRSKLTRASGCGALVEFPGFSGIMGGQNYWPKYHPEHMKIHEKVLEEYLGKDYFLQPSLEEAAGKRTDDFSIPIMRFPEYYFCPNCHELDYARRIAKNYRTDKDHTVPLICSNCGKELIPSRFVLACESGHITDFPYTWWVHKGKECSGNKLKLEYIGKTGGLNSIRISCETCGAFTTMANCLNQEAVAGLKCHGDSPWLGANKKCECKNTVRVLMRGASNVYYPQTISTLTIPPWSSLAQKVIDQNYAILKMYFQEGVPPEMVDTGIKLTFQNKNWKELLHCTEDEFLRQVKMRFLRNEDRTEISPQSMLRDEYKALMGSDIDDIYFKTETVEIADEFKPYFDKVKMVRRLREVQVLRGFRRINAYSVGEVESAGISDKREHWLPATESLGEGIFISFSKEKIKAWSNNIGTYYERMEKRYNANRMAQRNGTFSPEYVCIHTFSHLLMRELAFHCGYEAASIREKMYVSDKDDNWMAGVLIYTASTCSDGSLGGLVRQGTTKRLREVLFSMLERASWCSNDPICIEAKEQGNNSLNYAACHACSLVSETSCCCNNVILDRYAVVGSPEHRQKGYLGGLLTDS